MGYTYSLVFIARAVNDLGNVSRARMRKSETGNIKNRAAGLNFTRKLRFYGVLPKNFRGLQGSPGLYSVPDLTETCCYKPIGFSL